jgi:polyhydroxyalkanoate synthase subunit PhaC
LALRRRSQVGCVALLATPWDFHAQGGQAQLLGLLVEWLTQVSGTAGTLPVDAVQALFFLLDPFSAERKFVRFAALDSEGDEARRFVALEDWINDGVPLAIGVARECARSWYGDNQPGTGLWRVAGQVVRPQSLRRPVLAVVPGRDRIVPPSSAEPLAAALGTATVLRPPLGHIGMMSAVRAPEMLWTPIAAWLRAQLGAP